MSILSFCSVVFFFQASFRMLSMRMSMRPLHGHTQGTDSLACRELCPLHLCHGCAQGIAVRHLGPELATQELSHCIGIQPSAGNTAPNWQHRPSAFALEYNQVQATRPRIGNTGHPLLTLLGEAQGANIIARLAYVPRQEPTLKFQAVLLP